MTTPGVPPPEGAITGGDLSALDGLDEAAWLAGMKSGKLGGYEDAHQAFLDSSSAVDSAIADLESGMLALGDRVDLLESAPAYGQRFLSQSWDLSGGSVKPLPFDTWIGPHKDVAAVERQAPEFHDGIVIHDPSLDEPLHGAGLWRADLQIGFDAPATGWFGSVTVATVAAYLHVMTGLPGASSVYSTRRFDLLVSSYGAQSAAFSTTFVIPPEVDRAYVRAAAGHTRSGTIRLRGGTIDSCLSVNKWSIGTENAVLIDNPPDGGTL